MVWALCLALLPLSYSNAQVTETTGNLINYGTSPTDTTSTWNNGVYVNTLCFQYGQPGNCGPNPSIRSGGNINFSYGTTDLNQIVNINRALAAGGSGVQLSGFNFGFMAKNGNGWDDGRQDYLDAYVKFYNAGGGLAATYDYANQTNRKYNWTNFQFSETFSSPVLAANFSNARVGFIGRDNNYWAGNYGPEIYNVSFALKYSVDPCSTNPAYAPTCTGFSSVVTSSNLIPNNNLISGTETSVNTFAVNTALQNSGSGVEVYGFKYGYNYSLGNGRYGCTATNQDGSCSWWMTTNPTASVSVSLTNSNNNVIYSASQNRSTPNTAENVSYQFLLPSTTNSLSLGNFSIRASTTDNAAIQNMFVNALYKPDPCTTNPLSSATCPGYGAAFAKQLAATTPVSYSIAPTSSDSVIAAPQTISPVASQTSNQTQVASGAPTDNQTQQTQQSSAPVAAAASSAPTTSTTPSASNPQPKPGDVQVAGSNKSSSSSSNGPSSLAMSVVASVQAKVGATEKAVVQQANETAASASAQAVQLAESVAGSAQATSIASSMTTTNSSSSGKSVVSNQSASGSFSLQTSVQSSASSTNALKPYASTTEVATDTSNSNTGSTGIDVVKINQGPTTQITMVQPQQQITIQQLQQPQQQMQLEQVQIYQAPVQQVQPPQVQQIQQPIQIYQATVQQVQATQEQQTQPIQIYQAPVQQIMQPIVSYSLTEPSIVTFDTGKKIESPVFTEVEIPRTDGFKMATRGTLNDYMNEQPFMALQGLEATQDNMVKRNVQPNEAAGGVDIAAIATQPKGYDTYALMTLKDAAFYKVEEVYKNQKTVDNVRLLRGLTTGSDRRHQEMVDQQYKTGN